MSEWLTTGQLIDKLEVGEKAVCQQFKSWVIKNTDEEGILWEDGAKFYISNEVIRESKWNILPKYVTFEEAMKALRSGKTVEYKGHDGKSWNHKMTPHEFEIFGLGGTEFKDTGLRHLLDGKWQIIE